MMFMIWLIQRRSRCKVVDMICRLATGIGYEARVLDKHEEQAAVNLRAREQTQANQLASEGYGTVRMVELQATDFGSKALRKRLFWLCLLGEDKGRGEPSLRSTQLLYSQPLTFPSGASEVVKSIQGCSC